MRARSILSGAFTLALALAVAGAPARQLTDALSGDPHSGVELRLAAHPSDALVGTTSGAPDADLRPGDDHDPAPPLPGSTAGPLLLVGATAFAFSVVMRGSRLAGARSSGPHTPRAPPAFVTV